MRTKIVASPETAELAKLTETTYFALLIAWAQTVDRWCDELDADYDEVVSFYDEIPFFPPVKYFPGVIGGHCAMPNIELLSQTHESPFLDAIRTRTLNGLRGNLSGPPRADVPATGPVTRECVRRGSDPALIG